MGWGAVWGGGKLIRTVIGGCQTWESGEGRNGWSSGGVGGVRASPSGKHAAQSVAEAGRVLNKGPGACGPQSRSAGGTRLGILWRMEGRMELCFRSCTQDLCLLGLILGAREVPPSSKCSLCAA